MAATAVPANTRFFISSSLYRLAAVLPADRPRCPC
jgi:hypothetical protein